MPTISKGIDALPDAQIPKEWSSKWFSQLLQTWLRAADVRNATAVLPVVITGNGITPATISISGVTSGVSATIPLASLTPSGAAGSLTFTSGILTAVINPT